LRQNPDSDVAVLTVREMNGGDIDAIADYWLHSDPDFLVSMGVDLDKVPPRADFIEMLQGQLQKPTAEKQSYCLIWEIDGESAGHCNINNITFGKEASMHLHLWRPHLRQKGIGLKLLGMSLPYFFSSMQLKNLVCEPRAENMAPNKALEKLGFTYIRSYLTVPGSINYEQVVKRWELSFQAFEALSR